MVEVLQSIQRGQLLLLEHVKNLASSVPQLAITSQPPQPVFSARAPQFPDTFQQPDEAKQQKVRRSGLGTWFMFQLNLPQGPFSITFGH